DLLRVYAWDSAGLTIFEYDVKRKILNPTGSAPNGTYRFSGDSSKMIRPVPRDSHQQVSRELQIRDARSGALLQSIPGDFYMAKFLRCGCRGAIPGDQKWWMIVSAGAPLPVPVKNGADWIYESPGGPVPACVRDGWCTVVDASTGVVLRTEAGI